MSQLTRVLTNITHRADQSFDRLTNQIKRLRPITIVPYRWYGTADQLVVRGRVLRKRTALTNLTLEQQLHNFSSDEVPHARIRATFLRTFVDVSADDEGYFTAVLPLKQPVAAGWHGVQLTLLAPKSAEPVQAMASCLVPSAAAAYGIISDIDDTILLTDATSAIKVGINTLFTSPHERHTFPDVAAHYQAWQRGDSDNAVYNPLFYVSSSPWNIYDYLTMFMRHHSIPLAPLCLRDIGFDEGKLFAEDHTLHKSAHISSILNTYPELPFILVGDNGQDDPHIYAAIQQRFPKRIREIWIRDTEDDILRRIA